MQLLFFPRRAGEHHFGNVVAAVAIFVQPYDRSDAVINLLLVTVRCVLDLTPLITVLHRREHATEPFDFTELIKDGGFNCALDCFHSGRAAQHVHGVFKNPGLFEQDRLAVGRKPNPFFARCRERFVGAIRMTRIGRIHVSED